MPLIIFSATFFLDPPVALSAPHFYQGNKSLVKAVNGLHPMKSAHETFVDIEPVRKISQTIFIAQVVMSCVTPVSIHVCSLYLSYLRCGSGFQGAQNK